jgi:hypothetical protein
LLVGYIDDDKDGDAKEGPKDGALVNPEEGELGSHWLHVLADNFSKFLV